MSVRSSAFVQETRTGKRVTRWFLAIPIFLVFFVVNLGAALGLSIVWPVEPGSGWAQLQEGITDLVPILLVFAWVALFERRRIATLGFHRPQRGVLTLLLGVVVGVAMIAVPILILWAAGVYLGLQMPGWLAVVVPTLLFTVVHGVAGAPVTFTTILFYGLFAIFVVFTAWRRRDRTQPELSTAQTSTAPQP